MESDDEASLPDAADVGLAFTSAGFAGARGAASTGEAKDTPSRQASRSGRNVMAF